MKLTPARVRFLLEAAFLVLVAAICWAASLSWKGIVPAMAGAWVLVTLVERSANSERRREQAGQAADLRSEQARADAPGDVTVIQSESAPVAEQPPTPIPEPGPDPAPLPEPVPPAPEPSPPVPEPTPVPDPNPQLEVVPEPSPEAVAGPASNVAHLPQRDGAPREWNVWELERIAREREGEDATRDQELTFMLLELRQFANADGMLPPSFDPVIRETFGELLYAGI